MHRINVMWPKNWMISFEHSFPALIDSDLIGVIYTLSVS